MYNRKERIKVAEDTLKILETGKYTFSGQEINLFEQLKNSLNNTIVYSESEIESFKGAKITDSKNETTVVVTKNSVVTDAIIEAGENEVVTVLNFASARNAGGGFLNGSMAQEEAICYASGLYKTLQNQNKFYKNPKHFANGLYSHSMIYSPAVPIFKDSKGELISEPKFVNFITSPAVNVKDLKAKGNKELLKLVDRTMLDRIEGVIALAKEKGTETLILGAFGCGVFENNPYKVKDAFVTVLNKEEYKNVFKKVVFSIYEPPKDNNKLFNIFKQIKIRK